MSLQLNSEITKSLSTNFGRLGTSCRLIFVKDTVQVPTSSSQTALDAYFSSFMLASNANNYLGSVVVSGYQQIANTITFSTALPTVPLHSGTIGSVVFTHESNTDVPNATSTASTSFKYARDYCMCVTDSVGTIDSPQMVLVQNKNLVSVTGSIQFLVATITMVSAH